MICEMFPGTPVFGLGSAENLQKGRNGVGQKNPPPPGCVCIVWEH